MEATTHGTERTGNEIRSLTIGVLAALSGTKDSVEAEQNWLCHRVAKATGSSVPGNNVAQFRGSQLVLGLSKKATAPFFHHEGQYFALHTSQLADETTVIRISHRPVLSSLYLP